MTPPTATPITDQRQIQLLLEEAVRISAAAELVVDLDRLTASLQFPSDIYSPTEICFIIPPGQDAKDWAARLKDRGGSLSLMLSGSLISFDAKLVSFDAKRLILQAPKSVLKVQRRQTARVDIPTAQPLWILVRLKATDKAPLRKSVVDLSAGGVAFAVSSEEKSLFQRGQVLEELSVELPGHSVRTSGTVRGIYALRDGSGHPAGSGKVAVEFTKLAQKDEAAITRLVFELQRRLGRKI